VYSYWQHWPCLIPQHGPGKKHERQITWSWPHYAFKQVSADIWAIFCHACDALGLHWTEATATIYVSRKADVATLDSFIGPKR
jgi:hypothetical protein